MRCGYIGNYRYKNTVFLSEIVMESGEENMCGNAGNSGISCRGSGLFLHDNGERRAGLEIYRNPAAGYNETDPRKNGHCRDDGRM